MDKFKKNIFGQQIRDFDPRTVQELIQFFMNAGSKTKQMISDYDIPWMQAKLPAIRSSRILSDIRRREERGKLPGEKF